MADYRSPQKAKHPELVGGVRKINWKREACYYCLFGLNWRALSSYSCDLGSTGSRKPPGTPRTKDCSIDPAGQDPGQGEDPLCAQTLTAGVLPKNIPVQPGGILVKVASSNATQVGFSQCLGWGFLPLNSNTPARTTTAYRRSTERWSWGSLLPGTAVCWCWLDRAQVRQTELQRAPKFSDQNVNTKAKFIIERGRLTGRNKSIFYIKISVQYVVRMLLD